MDILRHTALLAIVAAVAAPSALADTTPQPQPVSSATPVAAQPVSQDAATHGRDMHRRFRMRNTHQGRRRFGNGNGSNSRGSWRRQRGGQWQQSQQSQGQGAARNGNHRYRRIRGKEKRGFNKRTIIRDYTLGDALTVSGSGKVAGEVKNAASAIVVEAAGRAGLRVVDIAGDAQVVCIGKGAKTVHTRENGYIAITCAGRYGEARVEGSDFRLHVFGTRLRVAFPAGLSGTVMAEGHGFRNDGSAVPADPTGGSTNPVTTAPAVPTTPMVPVDPPAGQSSATA